MKIEVHESGHVFGPFDPDMVFRIESSPAVQRLGDSVKKVEFLLRSKRLQGESIILVEAKKSIPRDSAKFIRDIHLKMLHSLTIWMATVAQRHPVIFAELPNGLKQSECARLPVKLLLVIPDMPDHFLQNTTDKLRKAFQIERRLWSIKVSDILVINKKRTYLFGLDELETTNFHCFFSYISVN